MKVCVVGAGYVGLVTSAGLSALGHQVTCVDVRADIVESINDGVSPLCEEGLGALICAGVKDGRLAAARDLGPAVTGAEVVLICVGTPSNDGRADLSQLLVAASQIGRSLCDAATWPTVVVKSTVPPGTTVGPVRTTLEHASGAVAGDTFGLGMNPEFLREGRAVDDFMNADRIVIGALDDRSAATVDRLYDGLACPRLFTSPTTAEMTKYVSNSFFATAISFSNEIANVCAALPGVDARDVWAGIHLDRRFSSRVAADRAGIVEYLWHGVGFGGSCLGKDVVALQAVAGDLQVPAPILAAVVETNRLQPERLVELLAEEIALDGARVAVLGLAFKPGTDDVRESPAIPIVATMAARGADVVATDPVALDVAAASGSFAAATLLPTWQAALEGADACCLVTGWPEYTALAPAEFVRTMRRPIVVDGRGAYNPKLMADAGATWRGIGLGQGSP